MVNPRVNFKMAGAKGVEENKSQIENSTSMSATNNGINDDCVKNNGEQCESADMDSISPDVGELHNGESSQESGSSSPETTEVSDTASSSDKAEDGMVMQDVPFTIKVKCPDSEAFELPVSSMELVQEIHQVLIDREDSCHRTCFSLQLDGQVLDNFAELKSIPELEEGSTINVVEEPYTTREARVHVRCVRDLLKSVSRDDAYNGIESSSLSFLSTVTNGDVLEKKRDSNKPDSIDCTPPDYILPGSTQRPLLPLHPGTDTIKALKCLKVLTCSGWNPPPGNRRMHGDLLYLSVVTLEDKHLTLTASAKGFFLNQSTQNEFNPTPANPTYLSHSLIDLLRKVSAGFKRNFATLLKQRALRHPFERVATPYQIFSWMAPVIDHSVDSIRAEDAFASRLGYEEHIPGQTRDWNEELQLTREHPRKQLPDRLIRERAIFKVHSDFVNAATRGAMSVIDGNIMAINPGDDSRMQMFLWNNIFFSLGFDVKEHYKDFGGDAAAYVAPSNDLKGVKAYASVDVEGVYTLGTVVVDYRGYRVTAQSIIPGILEREQEQSVIYGSTDFGKTVSTNDKYKELLEKPASILKIRPHKVVNENGEEVEIFSSVECKGIIGNDKRHYILDLLRTFPVDVNFVPSIDAPISDDMKQLGFPLSHRHLLPSLRQELIDSFVESRYIMFVKLAAYQLQQSRVKKQLEKEEENKEQKSIAENCECPQTAEQTSDTTDENAKEQEKILSDTQKLVEAMSGTKNAEALENESTAIVRKVAQEVGSMCDTSFEMSFNTDVFQPHVKLVEGEALEKDKKLVTAAAEYLVTNQIPAFIRDCMEHQASPIDGVTLTEALHQSGINIRYLGKVTEMIANYSELSYMESICMSELLTRTVKYLFKRYMQNVDLLQLAPAVSHFANCFLGSFEKPEPATNPEEIGGTQTKKPKRKNKGQANNVPKSTTRGNADWKYQTPKSMWEAIKEEIKTYFHFNLEGESLDSVLQKYHLQKVTLLRTFCKKVGLQIKLKEYDFDNKETQTFTENDIINIFPVVKHIHPKASDAYHIFTTGQQKIQQGLLREGYELITEALNLLNNVYGAMHPEIAACARLLARLNYIMGDYTEALAFQQRAALMSERVLGIDHPNTITEYSHLALYAFANHQIPVALKLLYHARYLVLLCHGENHPQIALFDSNIGLILHAVNEFDLSLQFLKKALELNTRFFGAKSLKVAMSYHLVARAYSCKGDFRTALQNEKEAFANYKSQLGDNHERTKESSDCLKHLTQQAVSIQKTMNEIYKGQKVNIPPIQIQTPTLANVLETLNLINGIVFLHISPEDIEKFREEMIRRQQQDGKSSEGAAVEGGAQKEITQNDKTSTENNASVKSDTTKMVDLEVDDVVR